MATTIGELELYPAFENMGVVSKYSGDSTGNNQATLRYRRKGTLLWKPGIPMTADRRDMITYYPGGGAADQTIPNFWARQWRAVIFGLAPSTEYEVKVTYTDPEGVIGTNPVTAITRTRNDNPPSNGNVYHVSTSGNDASNGSATTPWRTIQHAANAVTAGDRVLVAPGFYNEEVNVNGKIGTADNYISFESETLHGAVIDGNKELLRGFYLQNCQYVKISGFRILNSGGNPVRGSNCTYTIIEDCICEEGYWTGDDWARGGIYMHDNSHHTTIQRCQIFRYRGGEHLQCMGMMLAATVDSFTGAEGGNVIRDNDISGDFRDGIAHSGGYINGGLLNCFIYRNSVHDISDDDGIEADGPGVNVAIFENTISNIHHMAISLAPCSLGPCYVLRNLLVNCPDALMKLGSTSHGYVYVYHNTMHNPSGGQGPSSYGSNTRIYNHTYRNNIIATSSTAIRYGGETGSNPTNDIDYDCWQSGSSSQKFRWGNADSSIVGPTGDGKYTSLASFQEWTGQELHGIYANPLWVNPNVGDYRLQSASPCRDAGVMLPGFNDASSPWPHTGVAPDMGAVDYGAAPPPPTHVLTIIIQGQGQTDPTAGVWQYNAGIVAEVTAIPDAGWQFIRWTGNVVSTSNPVSLQMNSDISITAVFEQIVTDDVAVTITSLGHGATNPASGTHVYPMGSELVIEAIPDSGYKFDHWEGDASGSTNPISISLTQNISIVAVFIQLSPTPSIGWIWPALIGGVVAVAATRRKK